jgi:hypothetical protein
MRRTGWVGLAVALLAIPGRAEQIGIALKVHPQVSATPLGEPAREVRPNDPIERGLRVQLIGREALLLVGFDLGGCRTLQGTRNHRFTGSASFDGETEADLGERDGSLDSNIQLLYGKLRLGLKGDAGCPLEIKTPHAVIGVKGTYLRVRVDPVAGTFVAVDEGTVTVQAKAGGRPVQVAAGEWVAVLPGGLSGRPAPLPRGGDQRIFQDPPLLGCCDRVEPPKSRKEPP